MKMTERQLRRLVRETIINEAEFYDETPEGQVVGTKAEDAMFTQDLEAEKEMKSAGLSKEEISQMWGFIKDTEDSYDFMDTPMYEKLFNWFAFETGEMPYGTAKARDGMPDEWILDRLAA